MRREGRHFFRLGRSVSSTIRDLPSRFVTVCASAPPSWLRLPALPSSTLPTATSARRTWLPRCWPHAATIPAWCMSSRRWKRVPPTSPGIVNRPIKIYDKFALVLRIETTTNDVSTFKHYRTVQHQQGPASYALAPVKKNIYSLTDLRHILLGCNRRYVEYLSSLDDFSTGIRALDRLTRPRAVKGRTVKGLNFFSRAEQTLLAALHRPSFNISGLRRADLVPLVIQSSPPTLTRHLARLRQLGVIKRVTGTYRYYLTRAGRAAIAAARRLTEHTIIPALA